MLNPTPLVSVIIPTFNRPQFLPRAIKSALEGLDGKEIEVLVIPNGPDDSWKQSLLKFKDNPSVRVIPIPEANANIARNTGMANARGEFIRFLDDDDYLIPEGAIKQYQLIQTTGADMVSGSIQLIDSKGRIFDVWEQPDVNDLCVAVFGWRYCQPTAHVFKKSKLIHANWNSKTLILQDFEWLLDLCTSNEINWIHEKYIVGIWQHHQGKRTSTAKSLTDTRSQIAVEMLMRSYTRLDKEKRLTISRKHAIAQGLLSFAHSAFFQSPFYWSQVIKQANALDKYARPTQAIFNTLIIKKCNILLLEWIFLPFKWMKWRYKKLHKNSNIIIKKHIYRAIR